MRISTGMMQRLAVDAMLDRQTDLSKTQLQLASGKRILTPADDPTGTTQVLRINQQIDLNTQYQSNGDRALSRLQVEEGALTAAGDTMQRLRELAVQALNDSTGADGRANIATEVRQRLEALLDFANSKDGSGEYLFSGYQGNTRPFVDAGGGTYNWNGDQGQRKLQISETRQVATSDSGIDIFVDLNFSGGGTQDIFKTIYDFAATLDANNPDGNVLTDFDTAMDALFATRAKIGARINAIESQRRINEEFDVQLQSTLSGIQDLDYAEAVGRLNIELVGLQASQQTFQKIQGLSLFNYL
jgi:flagellar hook-associated protein 3 FlgL